MDTTDPIIIFAGTYLLILGCLWLFAKTTTGSVNYPALIKQAGVVLAVYTVFCLLAWGMLIASYWIGRM